MVTNEFRAVSISCSSNERASRSTTLWLKWLYTSLTESKNVLWIGVRSKGRKYSLPLDAVAVSSSATDTLEARTAIDLERMMSWTVIARPCARHWEDTCIA